MAQELRKHYRGNQNDLNNKSIKRSFEKTKDVSNDLKDYLENAINEPALFERNRSRGLVYTRLAVHLIIEEYFGGVTLKNTTPLFITANIFGLSPYSVRHYVKIAKDLEKDDFLQNHKKLIKDAHKHEIEKILKKHFAKQN